MTNQGLVVRVGGTVRRPKSPAGDAIKALLRHLEVVGFTGAPSYLGEDERGRDTFTFIEGEAVIEPYPAWGLTTSALASVAELLRAYHDAVRSFDPSGYAWPTNVPAEFRGGIVTHNDPNLDNVVFRDGVAVALIDFDLASPGSIPWDVGLAARLWVPLRAPSDVHDARRGSAFERLRVFLDAYGLAGDEREQAGRAAIASHDWCYGIAAHQARHGRVGFVRYWTPQAQQYSERGRRWLGDNTDVLVGRSARQA